MLHSSQSSDQMPHDADQASNGVDQRKGTFITDSIITGDVIGYQPHITEEYAYSVAGLPNPYLGLRAFTAADRDIFAGRERMVETLVRRLAAENGDRLLFLVGASGSGKSSLARAGLIPALEEYLRLQGLAVSTHILERPSRNPVVTIRRILNDTSPSSASMLLLLIDQFEELWSQAGPDEARQMLDHMLELAALDRPLRIVATLRSDFLPQLASDPRFERYERRKVMVRAMSAEELQDAIQRPVQMRHPNKRLEPGLVKQLVHDAAQDAAYLPLLQVTLEDLWRGGSMRPKPYNGLTDAIQRRAEMVFTYRDYDGLRQDQRQPAEQQALIALLLDLVRVSPGEELRETRWRRTRAELVQGDPTREQLITDLTAARLLRTDRETYNNNGEERTIETVDIVHEALLSGWPRLKEAIKQEQERLRQRERFLLAFQEWRTKAEHGDYLLRGMRLTEAEALRQGGDRVFIEPTTQRFYEASLVQRDTEQLQQIRRTRRIAAGLGTLALLALLAAGAAGWFGWIAQQRATEASDNAAMAKAQERRANVQAETAVASEERTKLLLDSNFVQRLAAQADSQRQLQPDLASLLAVESYKRGKPIPELQDTISSALYGVVAANGQLQTMLRGQGINITSLVFSKDNNIIISGDNIGTIYVWDINRRSLIYSIDPPSCGCGVVDVKSSNDGSTFAVAGGKSVEVYDTNAKSDPIRKIELKENIQSIAYNPINPLIIAIASGSKIYIWPINKPDWNLEIDAKTEAKVVQKIIFNRLGDRIISAGNDGYIRVWDSNSGNLIQEMTQRPNASNVTINALSISSNDQNLASSDWNQIVLWKLDKQTNLYNNDGSSMIVHNSWVKDLAFSPVDNRHLVSVSADQRVIRWYIPEHKPEIIYYAHRADITRVTFSRDGSLMATAGSDGQIAIWTVPGSYKLSKRIDQGNANEYTSKIAITLDGASIALFTHKQSLFIRFLANSIEKNQEPLVSTDLLTQASKTTLSSNGKLMAAGFPDGTFRLWDAEGTSIDSLGSINEAGEAKPTSVSALIFSPDQQWLAVGGGDGRIVIWNLAQPSVKTIRLPYGKDRGHTTSITSLAFSPDGRWLASGSYSQNSLGFLWDITTGTQRYRLFQKGEQIISLAFSPDSRLLISGGDQSIYVWDVATGKQRSRPMLGHRNDVNALSFSPSGNLLASGSQDGFVVLWNMKTFQSFGQPLKTATLDGAVRDLLFDGEERLIVAHYSSVWLVDLTVQHWLEAACRTANRSLTVEEWNEYIGDGEPRDTCADIVSSTE